MHDLQILTDKSFTQQLTIGVDETETETLKFLYDL